MATRPAGFGDLKKAKAPGVAPVAAEPTAPTPSASAEGGAEKPARIQTSIRLEPATWAALTGLATRKTVETGKRVTVHDLLLEGVAHVLAVNGAEVAR